MSVCNGIMRSVRTRPLACTLWLWGGEKRNRVQTPGAALLTAKRSAVARRLVAGLRGSLNKETDIPMGTIKFIARTRPKKAVT